MLSDDITAGGGSGKVPLMLWKLHESRCYVSDVQSLFTGEYSAVSGWLVTEGWLWLQLGFSAPMPRNGPEFRGRFDKGCASYTLDGATVRQRGYS